MAVVRLNKKNNYTCMSNAIFQNKNLSWRAKGLLGQMLTLPDEWEYSIRGIAEISKENERAVRTVLAELEEAGYLVRTQTKDENGRFSKIVYDIFEEPQIRPESQENQEVLPCVEKRQAENPQAESAIQKNNILKNNNKKIDSKKESQGEPDTYNDIIESEIDDPKVQQAVIEFIRMRKLIKKPITNYGLIDLINRLQQLSGNNPEIMLLMLNNSIRNSWPDIYLPLCDRETEQKTKPAFTNYSQREVNMAELEKAMFKT